jgi:curved DNA-binding protein CbpA
MSYFDGCTTSEEVKTEYRRLCKLCHPDLGPQEQKAERTRVMQEINAAYARASAVHRFDEMREHAKAKGNPEPTAQDYADAAVVDERIRQAIEQIITLEGLEIEICGLWVWVGGNTKPHREALKDAGYRWSPPKVKWYFAGVPAGRSRGMDMDEIRARYGSQRVFQKSRFQMQEADDA